jgi:hypothetical protein
MPQQIIIKQGECLTTIALARGFVPQTIWDHPDNAELKELRHTHQALLPGDRVVIPDLEEKNLPVTPTRSVASDSILARSSCACD